MREIKFRQRIKGRYGTKDRWNYWGYAVDDIDADFTGPIGKVEWDERPSYQYIGLHDKNGKEIYEGDIMKMQDNKSLVGVVSYKDGCFDFLEKWIGCMHPVEIIGNICENPELLKGV